MDSSILLQKQIRDNSEELRRQLTDLRSWEEEMKRKDQELSEKTTGDAENYPAIRGKAKRSKSTSETIPKPSEKKRISAFDYAAWDKFDVEEACAKVDVEDEEEEEENCGTEHGAGDEGSVESRDQAVYEKELGNEQVKNQNWKEAIQCYTRAIQCYPYDAVFYANRALCYLKTNNTKAAEADCTTALQLDVTYVKAFQRRGLARTQLGLVQDAKEDFLQVLTLDPSNSAAKSELAKLERKSTSAKASAKASLKVSSKTSSQTTPKAASQTTPKASSQTTPKASSQTTPKAASRTSLKSIPTTSKTTQKDDNRIVQESSVKGSRGDGDCAKDHGAKQLRTSSVPTTSTEQPWAPPWALPSDSLVVPVWKPPHLRSKKPLKSVAVKEVHDMPEHLQQQESQKKKNLPLETRGSVEEVQPAENSRDVKLEGKAKVKVENRLEVKQEAKLEGRLEDKVKDRLEVKQEAKLEGRLEDKVKVKVEDKAKVKVEDRLEVKQEAKREDKAKVKVEVKREARQERRPTAMPEEKLQGSSNVPPPPASSVQFLLAWKRVRDNPALRHQFLKQVRGETLPDIFQDALESREFSEVLRTLSEQFVPSSDPVYAYLQGFTQVKRFSALTMFMSAADKAVVRELISHCEETGQCSPEEATELYKKFEIKC